MLSWCPLLVVAFQELLLNGEAYSRVIVYVFRHICISNFSLFVSVSPQCKVYVFLFSQGSSARHGDSYPCYLSEPQTYVILPLNKLWLAHTHFSACRLVFNNVL